MGAFDNQNKSINDQNYPCCISVLFYGLVNYEIKKTPNHKVGELYGRVLFIALSNL
jgi:hypothetical protein